MKRSADPSSTPSNSRLLIGLAVRLAIVLGIALLLDATGFGAAADQVLRRAYYDVRGQRASEQRVILVAIDAPTIEAWGAPPWKAEQLAQVFGAVERGKPAVLGAVDDPARLLPVGAKLPDGIVHGRAVLPLDDTTVESVAMVDGDQKTATEKLLAAAGIPRTESEMAINFVGTRGLPTLSAVDVARGNIPAESFTGKIVVLGVTAQPYAGLVPTPIGALAPAQVQAHALLSCVDGAVWTTVPAWLRWLLIGVVCASAMILAHHLGTTGATVFTLALLTGILVFDYGLFAWANARFGAAVPLLAALLATAIERMHERLVLRRQVRDIAHWTRQWVALDSMRTDVPDDEPGYWLRVAGLAKLYLGCTSTIVAELPMGGSHLKLRVINGTSAKFIGERRRDVRRSPYRKAHLTLGPVWHDRFMNDDKSTATLLVPLVVRTTLIGFWIVNFPTRDVVAAPHMALIKTLAREIAMAIDRRRTATAPAAAAGLVGRALGAGRLAQELEEVQRTFGAHTQNQQELLTLGESMPFGVFVATLWGEIRYMNTAMKLVCKQEGLDPSSTTDSLPDVLCRLTGFQVAEVHQHLRKLVQELEELHLRGRDRPERPGRDFVLSWLKPAGDPQEAEQLILVCALPPRPPGSRAVASVAQPLPVAPLKAIAARAHDDHALTTPHLKVDLDELVPAAKRIDQPMVPDAALTMHKLSLGDAVFSHVGPVATSDGEDFSDEVTFIAAGASGRSSRSLPVVSDPSVKPDKTMPLYKVKVDDLP